MPEQDYYSYFEAEEQDGSIYYVFSTDNNCGYTVYFKMDEYTDYVEEYPLLLQNGYAFGFHRNKFSSPQKNTKDPLVLETIYKIITDFLDQKGLETVLLYHCDANDNKQACRNKLFNDWEKMVAERSGILKHSIEVIIGAGTENQQDNYLGFLTLLDNPLIEDIKSEFEDFSINLIMPKG